MTWKDFFKSNHVLWLEGLSATNEVRHKEEIAVLREQHEKEISRLEALNLDAACVALARIEDLKKTHAQQHSYVIEENQRLRDDVKRLQFLAIPALKNVEIEPDKTPPPSPTTENVYLGTPWQRVLAREIELQERAAKERFTRPVPAEGASDGSSGEGRVEAPLGEQGKPA